MSTHRLTDKQTNKEINAEVLVANFHWFLEITFYAVSSSFFYFTCSFAISLTRHLFISTQCTHVMSLLYYTMHSGLFPESLHTAQTVSPEVLKWAFTYVKGMNSNWLHAIYTDKRPPKYVFLILNFFHSVINDQCTHDQLCLFTTQCTQPRLLNSTQCTQPCIFVTTQWTQPCLH